MSNNNQFTRRRLLKTAGGIALVSGISAPAILRAQTADVIKIGHLTPRTGFLGPLGEYAVMAADLAVEEINAAGGMMGRKVELLKEDSVNPQTASTKAERMIERDKVACIIGEISSASCLTIAQVASRNKILYINTGGNSDALRGKDCQRYMFHVESQNSMYVKSVGRSFLRDGLVKGKRWYSLTADYAFGHDLLKVAKRFMEGNGGNFAGDDLVPTDAADFSAYLLKIREAKPDIKRVGILWTYVIPAFPKEEIEPCFAELNSAARSLNLELHIVEVANSDQPQAALAEIDEWKPGGLLLTSFFSDQARSVVMQFAVDKGLPSIVDVDVWTRIAAPLYPLLFYGPINRELVQNAVTSVDKILRGSSPGDLPIQRPRRFELIVNLKTAKAIGLDLPPVIFAQADRVIE